jgi:hypothetical protein
MKVCKERKFTGNTIKGGIYLGEKMAYFSSIEAIPDFHQHKN